jgi:hypothetical protein
MTPNLSRIALAVLLFVASGAGLAGAAEWQPRLRLAGTGKLNASHVGTLKVAVEVTADLCCAAGTGTWSAHDLGSGAEYPGHFYDVDGKVQKFEVIFDPPALTRLVQTLQQLVLDEAGLTAQVIGISQRHSYLKLTKNRTQAEVKLSFEISALVNGEYRTATYTLPLKGTVSFAH